MTGPARRTARCCAPASFTLSACARSWAAFPVSLLQLLPFLPLFPPLLLRRRSCLAAASAAASARRGKKEEEEECGAGGSDEGAQAGGRIRNLATTRAMPVRERLAAAGATARLRHHALPQPLGTGLLAWHAKLCGRLPLLLIAACCFLSVLLQARLLLPLIQAARDQGAPYSIRLIPIPGWPVRIDERAVLSEDFTRWNLEEFRDMSAEENARMVAEAEADEVQLSKTHFCVCSRSFLCVCARVGVCWWKHA